MDQLRFFGRMGKAKIQIQFFFPWFCSFAGIVVFWWMIWCVWRCFFLSGSMFGWIWPILSQVFYDAVDVFRFGWWGCHGVQVVSPTNMRGDSVSLRIKHQELWWTRLRLTFIAKTLMKGTWIFWFQATLMGIVQTQLKCLWMLIHEFTTVFARHRSEWRWFNFQNHMNLHESPQISPFSVGKSHPFAFTAVMSGQGQYQLQ